jgi:hypothetical protein
MALTESRHLVADAPVRREDDIGQQSVTLTSQMQMAGRDAPGKRGQRSMADGGSTAVESQRRIGSGAVECRRVRGDEGIRSAGWFEEVFEAGEGVAERATLKRAQFRPFPIGTVLLGGSAAAPGETYLALEVTSRYHVEPRRSPGRDSSRSRI